MLDNQGPRIFPGPFFVLPASTGNLLFKNPILWIKISHF